MKQSSGLQSIKTVLTFLVLKSGESFGNGTAVILLQMVRKRVAVGISLRAEMTNIWMGNCVLKRLNEIFEKNGF